MEYAMKVFKFTIKWFMITALCWAVNPVLGVVAFLFWLGNCRRFDVKEQRSAAIVQAYKEIEKRKRVD